MFYHFQPVWPSWVSVNSVLYTEFFLFKVKNNVKPCGKFLSISVQSLYVIMRNETVKTKIIRYLDSLSIPANDNQWCHFERFSTALWCSCSVRPWSVGGGGGGGGGPSSSAVLHQPFPPSCTRLMQLPSSLEQFFKQREREREREIVHPVLPASQNIVLMPSAKCRL